MISYATTDNVCRSRMLLEYFGEQGVGDCGHCDICIDRKSKRTNHHDLKEARQQLCQLLNDKKPHLIDELHSLPLPYETIEAALGELVAEEIIIDDDGKLSLS